MSHRRQFLAGSLAIAGACWAPALKAQAWPSRPIRIILPFPAGGTGDGVLRAMQGELSERLGQPLVMENLVTVVVGGEK